MNFTLEAFSEEPSTFLAIGGFGLTLVIIYVISILVIFPLYVYVHRINQKTDRLAYFYPITNHFYTVICSMQFYIYVTSLIAIVAFLLFNCQYAISVFTISFFIVYVVAVAVTSVQNVLLFVLAFRRFLILFLPNFKNIISINPKNFKLAINALYLFFIAVQVVSKLIKIFCTTDSIVNSGMLNVSHQKRENVKEEFSGKYADCSATCDSVYIRIYIAGDILVMLAAVLYGIMFIRIRRWSNMVGDPLNHPEKYIFYQTLLIVITKLLAICILFLVIVRFGYDDDWAYATFVLSDVLTTPFVIQVSYLLCNRANVDTILGMQFRKFRTWLILLCGEELRPKRKRIAAKRVVKNLIPETMKPPEPKTISTKDIAPTPAVVLVVPSLSKRRDTVA